MREGICEMGRHGRPSRGGWNNGPCKFARVKEHHKPRQHAIKELFPTPTSWTEPRHNAVAFSQSWAGVSSERAEAKTFWDEFFAVFGIKRRTVASFEEPVKKPRQSLQDRCWLRA